MTSSESQLVNRPWVALERTFRSDRSLQGIALVFAAISLLFLLSSASGTLFADSPTWAFVVLLTPLIFRGLVVGALSTGLDRLQIEERRFWKDVIAAFSAWLVLALVALAFPVEPRPPFAIWAVEALRAFFYAALILAVERRPHRFHGWRSPNLERFLAWPTATLFPLGLVVYFVVIPNFGIGSGSQAWAPSAPLYLILDAYLALRFLSLARAARSPRWRTLYSILSSTLAAFFSSDLLEWRTAEVDSPSWEALAGLLTYLPFLLIALVRVRHHPFTEDATRSRFEERSDIHFARPGRHTMIHALAFPLLHYGGYRLGLTSTAHRASHETLVVCMIVLLGAIAFFQHGLLERKARELWFDRERTEDSLRHSQTDLRLMIERYHADQKVRLSEEKFAKAFQVCPDAMAITALSDGRLKDVNDKFLSISGFERDEVLGRTTAELQLWIEPEERDRMAQTLKREGMVREMEGRFRTKNGGVVIGLFSAEQLILDGEPYLLSVTHDITERKRIEARLAEQIGQLEEASGLELPPVSS